jgi:hypothetical protein
MAPAGSDTVNANVCEDPLPDEVTEYEASELPPGTVRLL